MTPRVASMQITPVPSALLISGAGTRCVPHRHIPQSSTAFICRGKSCPSPSEPTEPLLPEPALCCWQAAESAAQASLWAWGDVVPLGQGWSGCSASLLGISSASQREALSNHNMLGFSRDHSIFQVKLSKCSSPRVRYLVTLISGT